MSSELEMMLERLSRKEVKVEASSIFISEELGKRIEYYIPRRLWKILERKCYEDTLPLDLLVIDVIEGKRDPNSYGIEIYEHSDRIIVKVQRITKNLKRYINYVAERLRYYVR